MAAVALSAQGCADTAPEETGADDCPTADDCAPPPTPPECQEGEAAPCFEGPEELVGVQLSDVEILRPGVMRLAIGARGAKNDQAARGKEKR